MLTNQDGIRERIIQIRKERGLSQNQLAKDFGISRTHYCNVENGKKPVTESFLKVLASGYKIPMEAFIPNENGDLMQYCECTNDFVNAIIDDYFNSFEIRKYYINKYEQPYYGVLSYLYDIGYTVEYELLQEAHLQDSFDTATGSVDVKEFAEDGVIHVYSNETGKDVAQIPLTKLSELEKEVKDFVEYKLSTYKVANPTKRSDLVPERKRKEATDAYSVYEEIIKDNIEYDHFVRYGQVDKDRLDEIVSIILETVCSKRKTIRIAGDDYPAELVKAKFMKLNSSHIEFVFDCMKENTTKIRNIKQYLKAVLFNAPNTIDSYYTALVAHDMATGKI